MNYVYIEKTLINEYVVSEVDIYCLTIAQEKIYKKGINIFGEKLPDVILKLEHLEKRFKAGKAISSNIKTYEKCIEFCKTHKLNLINYPLHQGYFVEFDCRFFKRD